MLLSFSLTTRNLAGSERVSRSREHGSGRTVGLGMQCPAAWGLKSRRRSMPRCSLQISDSTSDSSAGVFCKLSEHPGRGFTWCSNSAPARHVLSFLLWDRGRDKLHFWTSFVCMVDCFFPPQHIQFFERGGHADVNRVVVRQHLGGITPWWTIPKTFI
jgi:hypothetical protein